MNSEEMLALSGRFEEGDGDFATALYDAWDAICGQDPSFRRNAERSVERYASMVTNGAYLDAAMMLVPWGLSHMEVYTPDHQSLGWTVHLVPARRDPPPFTQASGFALKHEAALISAALRARAQSPEQLKGEGR